MIRLTPLGVAQCLAYEIEVRKDPRRRRTANENAQRVGKIPELTFVAGIGMRLEAFCFSPVQIVPVVVEPEFLVLYPELPVWFAGVSVEKRTKRGAEKALGDRRG